MCVSFWELWFHCGLIVIVIVISLHFAGRNSSFSSQIQNTSLFRNHVPIKPLSLELSRRGVCTSRKHVFLKEKRSFFSFDCFPKNSRSVWAAYAESINYEQFIDTSGRGERTLDLTSIEDSANLEQKPEAFRNRFLNFVRIGSIINSAAESFFKSEIRRRLFVTAVLIVISRLGYFIPLPGFDRRLMPDNYLSFISGSVGKKIIIIIMFKLMSPVKCLKLLVLYNSLYFWRLI